MFREWWWGRHFDVKTLWWKWMMMVMVILRALQGWLTHATVTVVAPLPARYLLNFSIIRIEAIFCVFIIIILLSPSWLTVDHYVNRHHIYHIYLHIFIQISFTDRRRVVQACRDCQLGWRILWRGFWIFYLLSFSFWWILWRGFLILSADSFLTLSLFAGGKTRGLHASAILQRVDPGDDGWGSSWQRPCCVNFDATTPQHSRKFPETF